MKLLRHRQLQEETQRGDPKVARAAGHIFDEMSNKSGLGGEESGGSTRGSGCGPERSPDLCHVEGALALATGSPSVYASPVLRISASPQEQVCPRLTIHKAEKLAPVRMLMTQIAAFKDLSPQICQMLK